jgi:broad specificity phosphatase PhoE
VQPRLTLNIEALKERLNSHAILSRLYKVSKLQCQHLIVFRHGQTDFNRDRRFQGAADVPLNKTGQEQAGRTADLVVNLLRVHFPHLRLPPPAYTSDLSRAFATAETVAKAVAVQRDLPLVFQPDVLLREWHCGDLAQHTIEEFERMQPGVLEKYYRAFENDGEETPYPGGESKRDVRERIRLFLSHLTSDLALVSSHGAWIHVLLDELKCSLPESDAIIGNGDVLLLKREMHWRVSRHYRVGDSIAASLGKKKNQTF